MPPQPIAELVTKQTSPGCISYRLVVDGRIAWRNRAFADVAASHAGCRARARAWALKHEYWIVEARQRLRVETALNKRPALPPLVERVTEHSA